MDSILATLQIIRWGRPSELANDDGLHWSAVAFLRRFENPVVDGGKILPKNFVSLSSHASSHRYDV